MKKILSTFILFSFCLTLFAKEKEKNYETYDEAKKGSEFLSFASKSTKFGIITTSFDGYARKFRYSYDTTEKEIVSASVTVFVSSLDTDSDGRNEKMTQTCLDKEKFPEITAALTRAISLNEGEIMVPIKLSIKGKTLEKEFNLKLTKENNHFWVEGKGSFSLKEFDIPDPSIAIASVRDNFDLNFKLLVD